MKKFEIYLLLLTTLAFTACKKSKDSDEAPIPTKQTNFSVYFNIKNQSVKLRLNNNVLGLDFYENVNLLAVKDSLENSYAIIFNEDFKSAELGKFGFWITGKTGNTTLNYADNNLNNIALSSVKDTVMNNVVYTSISFSRVFYFGVGYDTNAEALTEYNYLLTKKDVVGFSSYVTNAAGQSTPNTTTASITYSAY